MRYVTTNSTQPVTPQPETASRTPRSARSTASSSTARSAAPSSRATAPSVSLTRFAWLSIAAALTTMALKYGAYLLTGSVSLLSDALESIVNLVAAIVALVALKVAGRPADSRYTFGRSKAEYFSAAIEGAMIFVAAAAIIVSAIDRLIHPALLEQVGLGLVISSIAALINGAVGIVLLRTGTRTSSPTLKADGKHLLTDVVTTAGVIIGVIIVAATGWIQLDPIVAILVALNIIVIGIGLVRSSMAGLLDAALPEEENQLIISVLRERMNPTTTFHGLQTRQSGRKRYVRVDAQVPGEWTVARGHAFGEELEDAIRAVLPDAEVTVHMEPIEDPRSYADIPEGYIPLTTTFDALQPHAVPSGNSLPHQA